MSAESPDSLQLPELPPYRCQICQRQFGTDHLTPLNLVRPGLRQMVETDRPGVDPGGFVCEPDLNRYRQDYVRKLLEDEDGEVSNLEQEVLQSMTEHELLAKNLNDQFEEKRSFGQIVSDKMAAFGGSWKFIITFALVLVVWIIINILFQKPFDPFPFILLNLLLSCLAAIQAPVIMMSQNRQEAKDRLRAEEEYKVNLKAELEIRTLIAKIDQLRKHQWQRLLELQNMQLDLMEELSKANRRQETSRATPPPG